MRFILKLAVVLSAVAVTTAIAGEDTPPQGSTATESGGSSSSGKKFPQTPELAQLPEGTVKLIRDGYKGDGGVLDFSGMVYNPHRHKIMAFGGGHSTAHYPNSVHEFDLRTLQWEQVSESVPPEAYTPENAIKDKDGNALGGVRWKGKVWPASRHTYDGLVVPPEADVLVCVVGICDIGASNQIPNAHSSGPDGWRANYKPIDWAGLFVFDSAKKEWSVIERPIVPRWTISEIAPGQPDWIYGFNVGTGNGRAMNWRTGEFKKLKPIPTGTCNSLEYCPDTDSFWYFPGGAGKKACEYDYRKDTWKEFAAQGDAPSTYDCNVVYDSRSKVFGCFHKGYFHYYSFVENKWYKVDKLLNVDLDGMLIKHHHIYDPIDNVHIATHGRRGWSTYAFKLSDSPEKLPGSGLSRKPDR